MRRLVVYFQEQKKYEEIVTLLETAMIEGQAQPWMYDILALTMEIVGRPKDEVERVLLSSVDFAGLDVHSRMFTAAFLQRQGRREQALELYRQASSLEPTRPEPYVMGLKLALAEKNVDAIEWACCGILKQGWTKDHEALHKAAKAASSDVELTLKKSGEKARLEQFQKAIAAAQIRDLMVKLTWTGSADLDLLIEEPSGTVCSSTDPWTRAGGVHLNDGFGPNVQNTHESYICSEGVSGDYRLVIRLIGGNVVAKKVTLTIQKHVGTKQESKKTVSIPLVGRDTAYRIVLESGRRKELNPTPPPPKTTPRVTRRNRPNILQLMSGEEQREARVRKARYEADRTIEKAKAFYQGAVGYSPVVGQVFEGVSMRAGAVVSPDRRYVRLSLSPTFSTISDVFTFTFANIGAGLPVNNNGGQPGQR